ncbi:MAG TPA: tetratricopeptide repeat protein [Vicinamibacteria bacterium]|nr:tetratricopeptide repeat protein [Vicinamibacteria bacterium]
MIRGAAALLLLALPASAACRGDAPAAAERVTFNRDIAPLVHRNCAPCHRPGEAGPFSLLTYADVKKRADQIVEVTGTRYMPPWPPEPGYGDFAGARRLSDADVALLRRWVDSGAPEGAPEDRRPPPTFTEGWQLGPPDLVLALDAPFTVPAEGTDVFHNFVLPLKLPSARYVRAMELRPGDKRVVHHANVLVDRTGSARRQDARDPGPGFAGMDVELESDSFEPDSHFLFWKPGTAAVTEPDDMAWRVDAGTDLVLNLHLQPSGKPEPIRPLVGLYFTDRAPTRFPMLVQLEHDGALDIAPGAKDFVVDDHYVLPVDAELLGVYPHAHYIGHDVRGFATLPDDSRKELIWIRDWDLNWQAVYRYRTPVFLPRGSRVEMRIQYDNSADNPRNPSDPPRRVKAGNRSSDEMGHLWLQLLPRSPEDRVALQEALMRRRLEKYPGDFVAHANLGAVLEARGQREDALREYRLALRARPESAAALNNVGALLLSLDRPVEALAAFRDAVRADPGYANARYNLGSVLVAHGRFEEAVPHFREVARRRPEDVGALTNLGGALLAAGRAGEALVPLERAAELDPRSLNARFNLGRALVSQGRFREALPHLEAAARLAPADQDARRELLALRKRLAASG